MKSLLIPVHNEARYLPDSLEPLKQCNVDEIVFLLDRCTDESFNLVNQFFKEATQQIILIQKEYAEWKHGGAEAFETLCKAAHGDILYTSAGDFITDPVIFQQSHKYDLQSYRYNTKGEPYRNLLSRLPITHRCGFGKWSGHFSMKREVWEKLHFHDVASNGLDLFQRAYGAGFTHRYFSGFNATHLRSGATVEKQLEQVQHRKHDLIKTVGHAILTGKLHLLRECLRERINDF